MRSFRVFKNQFQQAHEGLAEFLPPIVNDYKKCAANMEKIYNQYLRTCSEQAKPRFQEYGEHQKKYVENLYSFSQIEAYYNSILDAKKPESIEQKILHDAEHNNMKNAESLKNQWFDKKLESYDQLMQEVDTLTMNLDRGSQVCVGAKSFETQLSHIQ